MKTGLLYLAFCISFFAYHSISGITFQQQNKSNPKTGALKITAESSILWTGVAVSKQGRIFANYPRWNAAVNSQVIEITANGDKKDYPNRGWNDWEYGKGIEPNKFIAVQSVYIDNKDFLWILDSGNPLLKGVQQKAAKLVKINLMDNSVSAIYNFDLNILEHNSYLNDVRIDTEREYAYITDSGVGAIIIVNLKNSEIKKVLNNHYSTKAENVSISINGNNLGGVVIHSDAIALDKKNDFLYYKALTGHKLYKIRTEYLRNFNLSADNIKEKVEYVADVGICDGIEFHPNGDLLISSIEDNSIKALTADGVLKTVIMNNLISWPDSFSITEKGKVYFTVSQLHAQDSGIPFRILEFDYN